MSRGGLRRGEGNAIASAPYELVIFDCDGVLVDSERIAVRIEAQVLQRLGWPLGQDEIVERFLGRSQEYMVDEFQHLYDDAFEAELTPVDGIVEALEEISTATCVASSGSHDRMRRTLGLTGLYDRFVGRIFSAAEVAHGKPAPDLFLHAAEQMGVDPQACAVIEDSRYGVKAARSAGMQAFGYAGGLTPAAWLEGPGTVVFDDMRELPRLLIDRGRAAAEPSCAPPRSA